MARGISITPMLDREPLDLQSLRDIIGTTFYAFMNEFKTGSAINADAIIGTHIAAGAISSPHLANDAITGAKINDAAITTGHIATNTVVAADIATAGVGTAEIADDAVTAGKIGADTITTGNIATGGVAVADIADDAVTAGKIGTDTITTGNIATAGIATADIANNAITSGKVGTNAISTDTIATSAVTNAKIADDAVSAAKVLDGEIYRNAYFAYDGCTVGANAGGTVGNQTTITVKAGVVCAGGSWVAVAGGSVAGVGITTIGYKDIIIAKGDGSLTFVRGTTAVPASPATSVVLASIIQTTNSRAVSSVDIGNSARFALSRI